MRYLHHVPSVVLISFAMLILTACHMTIESQNSTDLDGVKLKYDNAISLSSKYDLPNLEILGGTLSVSLKGHAVSDMSLAIKYKEYEPGDATVYFSDGKIQTKSKSGKPVAIYDITGDIPEHLELSIKSGTGDIELSGLKGRQNIAINSGTGDLELIGSSIGTLSVKMGTGSITLSDSQIDAVSIKTGTGDLILNNSIINQQDFSTGTGKIIQKGVNPIHKNKGSI